MKRVNVHFIPDNGKKDIDVVFRASEKDSQLLELMDRVSDPLGGSLSVYDSAASMVKVPESSIISISTDDKKLKVTAEDGIYELRMPLFEAGKLLHPEYFIQISRYEIINISKVIRFDFSIAGTLQIELAGGVRTWASRRFIPEIKNKLKERNIRSRS